jgi:tRNA(Ile)-lysidine synthase
MVDNDGVFIKPLLPFAKVELLQFLQEKSLEWHEDTSNQSRDYKRNKVRLDLIPILSEISGGTTALEQRLSALVEQSSYIQPIVDFQMALLNEDVEYRKYWEGYYTLLFRSDPQNIPKLVLIELIYSWVKAKCGLSLSYGLLQDIVKLFDILGSRKSVKTTISKNWDICLVGHELRLIAKLQSFPMDSCCTSLQFGKLDLTIKHPPFITVGHQAAGHGYRKISFPISSKLKSLTIDMRFSYTGERLPSKHGEGSKINDLALHQRVPTHERDRIILLMNTTQPMLAIFPEEVVPSGQYFQKAQEYESQWISVYLKFECSDTGPVISRTDQQI